MAFSRLFVFWQILFYRDFEWDKETFLLSYFCVTKRRVQDGVATSERRRRDGVYQKSARRTRAVLLPNHWRRARVSRASHAWQVRAAKDKSKVGGFAAPHDSSHTTRANISHEKAEQIRARIACTPAEGELLIGKSLFK